MTNRAGAALSTLLAIALLSACGSPSQAGPRVAVRRFATALSDRDGGAACRLLTPSTASKVAASAGKPCATAVLGEGLPSSSAARDVRVWGRQAQVRTDTDTLFLNLFRAGWRVTAAGCHHQGEAPYDCDVESG